uniref:KIF-binding protein n=1 Tax=Glossina austeni TaxID=7395 RepID=A0A1A9UWE9_GLOAU
MEHVPHQSSQANNLKFTYSPNELGIAYANRMKYKQSLELLSEVETCYKEFNKSENKAMSITDIFRTPEEIEVDKSTKEFESLYTLCWFYLAQVYGHFGELEKSAQYCHMTLKRQYSAQTYEPIDFALNSATLSQYFIGQNMFKEARHHLAAATLIIAEYASKISHMDNSISRTRNAKICKKHSNIVMLMWPVVGQNTV